MTDIFMNQILLSERKYAKIHFYRLLTLSKSSRLRYIPVKVIAGGTPTFPIHTLRKNVETSPGTTLLWDWGYSSSFSDMDFLHAAVLLTRIISKPGIDLLCLDLGHKAVASEMPQPRIKLLGIDKYTIVNHNEEHMVIRTPLADKYKPGDALYALPCIFVPLLTGMIPFM